ncbi:MAG: tRNA threonylcarbamoyladenosine biosynthesis protein TsaE [Pseudohongiellaceae bacterium]|jgi:tRNA threonylcarbamoyladenosine biosynthesis protein TsaE
MNCDIYLADEEATLAFGTNLARATFANPVAGPDTEQPDLGVQTLGGVIHMHGDLGAGKTTLARGFMRGYGVKGAIKSPTYTLVEPYELRHCQLYHLDLYRLGSADEVEYLGIQDYFHDNSVCLIEWPDKGGDRLPPADLSLYLSSNGTGRALHCRIESDKGALIYQRLSL